MHFQMHFHTLAILAVVSNSLASVIEKPRAITPRVAAPGDDCVWAGKYSPQTWLSCTSNLNSPSFFVQKPGQNTNTYYLTYKILMQGTGQDIKSWCRGIVENIQEKCGRRAIQNYSCRNNENWNHNVLNGDDNWGEVQAPGMEMEFDLFWGAGSTFAATDHDHNCMAKAIVSGTCPTVSITNGASCISDTWDSGATDDDEFYNTPGPPIDQYRSQ